MKFEKIKPGMKLYEVGRTKLGNTKLSTISVWPVFIVSVDPEKRTVVARWNGNAERTYSERTYSKWKEKEPILITDGFGRKRRPTREELAEIRAKEKQEKENTKGNKP